MRFKSWLIGITLLGAASALAQGDVVYSGHFQLSSFGSGAPAGLQAGIQALLSGTDSSANAATIEGLARKGVQFRQNMVARLEAQRRVTTAWPVVFTRRMNGPLATMESWEFSFPSLVTRGGGHPSDTVRGVYYSPRPLPRCHLAYPTLVLVHSSVDNQENGELPLARNLVSLSQAMGVMMIYLPHYGPRRLRDPRKSDSSNIQINDDFVVSDFTALQLNAEQSLLDLHMAMDWLRSRETVDPRHIAMMGSSLGAFFQVLYESVDPGRVTTGHVMLVGGGDFATTTEHYIKAHPQERFSQNMIRAGWNAAQGRLHFAPFDPVTWASQIHAQNFLMISAARDEIVDRNLGTQKLAGILKTRNHVTQNWMDSPHNPGDESVPFLLRNVFAPVEWFVMQNVPKPIIRQCLNN